MNRVTVFYNQSYLERPKDFPKQKERLAELREKLLDDSGNSVSMLGLNFSPEAGVKMADHLAEQLVGCVRQLTHSKVVAFFGDGGAGLFLNGVDQVGRQEQAVRENPVCLGPGGTYIHGAKAMGTADLDDVEGFVEDDIDYHRQLVKIRNCQVTKANDNGDIVSQHDYPFFAFAGMYFDPYILHLNENIGRTGSRWQNTAKIITQAAREIFLGNRRSKLRAFTTLPRWGFARFQDEISSLSNDKIFLMESIDAGALDMVKISAVINIIGQNRELLGHFFRRANGHSEDVPLSVEGILSRFKPKPIDRFTEKFDTSLLGGLAFSTDGFPHQVELNPGEEATLDIFTDKESGVRVVKKL